MLSIANYVKNNNSWMEHITENNPYYAVRAAKDLFLNSGYAPEFMDEVLDALDESGASKNFIIDVERLVVAHIDDDGEYLPTAGTRECIAFLQGQMSLQELHTVWFL